MSMEQLCYDLTQIWMEQKRLECPDFDTVVKPQIIALAQNLSGHHSIWSKSCEDILEHLYHQVTK